MAAAEMSVSRAAVMESYGVTVMPVMSMMVAAARLGVCCERHRERNADQKREGDGINTP